MRTKRTTGREVALVKEQCRFDSRVLIIYRFMDALPVECVDVNSVKCILERKKERKKNKLDPCPLVIQR